MSILGIFLIVSLSGVLGSIFYILKKLRNSNEQTSTELRLIKGYLGHCEFENYRRGRKEDLPYQLLGIQKSINSVNDKSLPQEVLNIIEDYYEVYIHVNETEIKRFLLSQMGAGAIEYYRDKTLKVTLGISPKGFVTIYLLDCKGQMLRSKDLVTVKKSIDEANLICDCKGSVNGK